MVKKITILLLSFFILFAAFSCQETPDRNGPGLEEPEGPEVQRVREALKVQRQEAQPQLWSLSSQ